MKENWNFEFDLLGFGYEFLMNIQGENWWNFGEKKNEKKNTKVQGKLTDPNMLSSDSTSSLSLRGGKLKEARLVNDCSLSAIDRSIQDSSKCNVVSCLDSSKEYDDKLTSRPALESAKNKGSSIPNRSQKYLVCGLISGCTGPMWWTCLKESLAGLNGGTVRTKFLGIFRFLRISSKLLVSPLQWAWNSSEWLRNFEVISCCSSDSSLVHWSGTEWPATQGRSSTPRLLRIH